MKKLLLTAFILFYINQTNAQFVKLLDFSGATNGANPNADLYYDGTYLYGTTANGGTSNDGTVFKIKTDGSGYVKLLDCAGATNGIHPLGSLVSDGTFLYGMTNSGGTSNQGTIFKIMLNGGGYTKLMDFSGLNGGYPDGSLIYDGIFLYGMTSGGGANNKGIVFKIMPNGSGFVKLVDFVSSTNGANPYGSLILNNGCLYGMTFSGGINNDGTVFSYCGLNDIQKITSDEKHPKIYPNPANNKITIDAVDVTDIKLFDILGKQITSTKTNDIDVSNLPDGVYFIQVKTSTSISAQKIIVQH